MSEKLVSIEFIEDLTDYSSVKTLRHVDGYVEWVESEEKRDGLRDYPDR